MVPKVGAKTCVLISTLTLVFPCNKCKSMEVCCEEVRAWSKVSTAEVFCSATFEQSREKSNEDSAFEVIFPKPADVKVAANPFKKALVDSTWDRCCRYSVTGLRIAYIRRGALLSLVG